MGISAHSERTLLDRAIGFLRAGPQPALMLSRAVLGLQNPPLAVAERLAVALLSADPRVRQLDDGRWTVLAESSESPLLEHCVFAVVDVETTGTRSRGDDRVTEIAVVVVQGDRRELVFESLVNPGRLIPSWVTRLTGISDDLVRRAPPFYALTDQVLAALAGRVFVAHNASFDWAFVNAEVKRARELALSGPRICTVRLARRLVTGIRSRSLDSLTYFFGLENKARHRAGGDALVTAEVLARLLSMARDAGVRTLSDLSALRAPLRPKRSAGVNSVPEIHIQEC